jgi:hypothetical protein
MHVANRSNNSKTISNVAKPIKAKTTKAASSSPLHNRVVINPINAKAADFLDKFVV